MWQQGMCRMGLQMSKSLLLYSHDFHINVKKLFKPHDVHMIDINAEVLNKSTHKTYKLMSELVECLFDGYDKLTLVTNYDPNSGHHNHYGERSLVFMVKTNDIKDAYELNDFHAAVMSHVKSHRLLVESQMLLRKELVNSTLSKATSNLNTLNTLIYDYDTLISKSKSVLAMYAEDIVLRFGAVDLSQH